MAHGRRRWKVIRVMRVDRIQHWVVQQQCRHKLKDMLSYTLGRNLAPLDIFGPLTDVNPRLLTRSFCAVTPVCSAIAHDPRYFLIRALTWVPDCPQMGGPCHRSHYSSAPDLRVDLLPCQMYIAAGINLEQFCVIDVSNLNEGRRD